ncbi:MAG: phosphatase PAP2 family protein [Bacteroidales bacterium]|nr:phosphatase PAP2 family protein [Bacteroidales bacterium]MBN2820040.1 phosphatase PAP2 family protein [Bacteroidales bacterium]
MKNLLSNLRFILIVFLLVWLILLFVLVIWTKAEIHLYVNQYHNHLSDAFFKYITNLGDGLMPAVLLLIFLFISFRKAFAIGLSGALAGIVSQVLKRLVFKNIPRPKSFFKDLAELYFVPGVDVHSSYSFPSGHSATAFTLFLVLAYYSKSGPMQLLYLFLALAVGYSRIYLSQHFLIDVYFGALIGIISAFVIIMLIDKSKAKWLDSSITKIIRKKA